MTDPDSGDTLAFICARTADGPSDERGAIGLARSARPAPLDGRPTRLRARAVRPDGGTAGARLSTDTGTCCSAPPTGRTRVAGRNDRAAYTTTYYVVGADPTGPFTTEPEPVTHTASDETHYAGKLHPLGDQLVYLATVLHDDRGASSATSRTRTR